VVYNLVWARYNRFGYIKREVSVKIIVAGGTGFIGKALVQRLTNSGHSVLILQRPGSKSKPPNVRGLESAVINLQRPVISDDVSGDAIINLVGIIREFPSAGITFHAAHFQVTKNLVDYAKGTGIKRFLLMSALGVSSEAKTAYQKTKYEAESYLLESGLDSTIFRPSVVFGPGSDFIKLMVDMVRRFPLVVVCAGFQKALTDRNAIGRSYEFGGPEIMTYNRLLDIIGEVLGKKKVRKLHQPLWVTRAAAILLGRFRWFPVTNEQITMLLEGSFTEDRTFFEHFGIKPKEFRASLLELIK
jgi:NADH dehydrogenase